jgi:HTH-type transcriptional regulator/antitoxin HigA
VITNERQYAITKAQVERFKEALVSAERQAVQPLPPRALKAMREGIESQLLDLQEELADYERLRDGTVKTIVADSILDLAVGLVKARIVRNWTQKELAERLGLPEQQIQRYEATLYKGMALERLQEVADALRVGVREVITIESG